MIVFLNTLTVRSRAAYPSGVEPDPGKTDYINPDPDPTVKKEKKNLDPDPT